MLELGMPVNHKRVARPMREAGIQGLYRRRNRRGPTGPATEDDLVHRQFAVDAPDRLWLTDIERVTPRQASVQYGGAVEQVAVDVAGLVGMPQQFIHSRSTGAGYVAATLGKPMLGQL